MSVTPPMQGVNAMLEMSAREFWTVFHGMLVGAVFLMAFTGGLAELHGLRREEATKQVGLIAKVMRLKLGLWTMMVASWATVVSGTFFVYPWYRDAAATSPRSRLLADPLKANWHTFGMELKEHVAWISPILSTVVLFLVVVYGVELARRSDLRRAALVLYVLAFLSAAVAGVFGAFLNKVAPIL